MTVFIKGERAWDERGFETAHHACGKVTTANRTTGYIDPPENVSHAIP
jgi:hypothetical protein